MYEVRFTFKNGKRSDAHTSTSVDTYDTLENAVANATALRAGEYDDIYDGVENVQIFKVEQVDA